MKFVGNSPALGRVAVERTISSSVAVIYELDKFVYGGKWEVKEKRGGKSH